MHITSRNATLVNLLVMPGLGTLLAGRILAGSLQMLTGLTGFTLVLIWFARTMVRYYSLMFGAEAGDTGLPSLGMAVAGGVIFTFAWVWALVGGIVIAREESKARREQAMNPEQPGAGRTTGWR